MYDIFYVSTAATNDNVWLKIKTKYPIAQRLSNITTYSELKSKAFTKMFWVIWDDIILNDSFNLTEYTVTKWDNMYVHVFKNGDYYDGICLFPKNLEISQREFKHRFFTEKKEVDIQASIPTPFNKFHINTYEEYLTAVATSTTGMFWVIWNDMIVADNFKFDYQVATYDQRITHIFRNGNYYDGICLFSKDKTITKKEFKHRFFVEKKEIDIQASTPMQYPVYSPNSYDEYSAIQDNMFWVVWPEIEITDQSIFNLYFSHHNSYDRRENHVFKNMFNGTETYASGVVLFSKEKKISQREFKHRFLIEKKEHSTIASSHKTYDVVFISYNEPNADKNYNKLLEICPRAKRVHGVKGIHQAHIKAAEISNTDMIWVVDGDATIIENFNFDLVMSSYDIDCVHVWRSQNAINKLEYGNGGVKLLPRQSTLSMDVTAPDMTTSISKKFKAVMKVSNINSFNTDEFTTWRSAFRECCKLASRVIERQHEEETQKRLEIWCSVGETEPFGKYAIDGARAGREYGLLNKDNSAALQKINDFDWLKNIFEKTHE